MKLAPIFEVSIDDLTLRDIEKEGTSTATVKPIVTNHEKCTTNVHEKCTTV